MSKKILVIVVFFFCVSSIAGTIPFITTWETTLENESINIKTIGTGYNYTVDWGDGTITTNETGDATHEYATAGVQKISITGDFPRIYLRNSFSRLSILTIEQWGDNEWTSMESAFYACIQLDITNPTIDIPNLSKVTSMDSMFYQASLFDGDISGWDVSNVEDMGSLFNQAYSFNQDIGGWDVSNVKSMSSMFLDADLFNQDIGGWDVSNVENMSAMFRSANVFDQYIGGWDVSSVEDMSYIFTDLNDFNQDLSNWDVSSVTNMEAMFWFLDSFNQDIGGWDVSNVENMGSMFSGTNSFNQDIGDWDVSKVTSMRWMFKNAMAFDQDVGNWDVSKLKTGFGMFEGIALSTSNYDKLLIGWGSQELQSNVAFSGGESKYCISGSVRQNMIDRDGWIVTDGNTNCTIDAFITTWQTTTVNESITIPTSGGGYNYTVDWGDGIITSGQTADATHVYTNAGVYTLSITGDFPSIYFNGTGDKDKILTIEQWGNIVWGGMTAAFKGCTNLQGNFIDAPNLSNVTSMNEMFMWVPSFDHPIGDWDVSNIKYMSSMFLGASAFNQDLDDWDVSNALFMASMFQEANVFNGSIDNWNVSSVINMAAMFQSAEAFNQDIGNWNVSSVTDMNSMFDRASSFNQDISFKMSSGTPIGDAWDVSKVENMWRMFSSASAFNHDIGNWDVSKVNDFGLMFFEATSFDVNIGSWSVGSATNMSSMFFGASAFNQDIGGWNVSNVKTMISMFKDAIAFDQNIETWDVSKVTNATDMFSGVALSIDNYDALLIGWNAQALQSGVTFSGGNSLYCLGEDARTNMKDSDGWVITDAGYAAPIVTDILDQPQLGAIETYTFEPIGGTSLTGDQAYYTGVSGTGDKYKAGDVISYDSGETYPLTLYIYDGSGTCSSEESFELVLTEICTISVNNIGNQTETGFFTFPTILGISLTGNQAYYTNVRGTGIRYNAGDVISYDSAETYPLALYIYNESGTCSSEESFELVLTEMCTISVNNIGNQTETGFFTFPTILGTSLTGNQAYYTNVRGTGIRYNSGDVISYDLAETYPITIYVYDKLGTCSSEESFDLIITEEDLCAQPIADVFFDVEVCNEYILPALSLGNSYYTNSGSAGNQLFSGYKVIKSQKIYIYKGESNTCFDESSFFVQIENCKNSISIIPDFFTPNNDGIYDVFAINNTDKLDGLVSIFDRFGQLLDQFEINSGSWDGKYNGKDMPSSTYWYLLVTSNKQIKGSFVLVR